MLHLPPLITPPALVPLGPFGVSEGKFQVGINLLTGLFPYSVANHLRAVYTLQYVNDSQSFEFSSSPILKVLSRIFSLPPPPTGIAARGLINTHLYRK